MIYEGSSYGSSSGDGYNESYRNRDEVNLAFQEPQRKYTTTKRTVTRKTKRRFTSSMPDQLSGHGEKVIVVDPSIHAWGAYSASGQLLRSGMATAGGNWCPDIHRSCRTKSGTFRIQTLGNGSCYSRKYPVGRGGAPMPYCMFFNGGQGLHGSYQVVPRNVSHGCVRLHVDDAEWIRYNFAGIGTKVIVRSY
jgi:lipoprotein-anchoring transpeptidase ErfK/SrfK